MEELKIHSEPTTASISRTSLRSSTNIHQKPGDHATRNFNILPKLANGKPLNIFTLFALYANSGEFNINLPTTLIKSEEISVPCLLRTKNNGILCSRQCKDNDFFIFKHKTKNCEGRGYLYKSPNKDSILFNSKENAENFWNSAKDLTAMMQNFVECQSNPRSIIRVVWRSGMKSKYFTIINRIHIANNMSESPKKAPATPSLYQRKKSLSLLGDFKYTDMLHQTSRSINNPFKVAMSFRTLRREKTRSDRIMTANKFQEERHPDLKDFHFHDQNNLIVNPKIPENILVLEDSSKGAELDMLIEQVILFLNSNVYKEEEVNGIILDFIPCRQHKWVLLDCKEVSVGRSKTPYENGKKSKIKRRTSSNGDVNILKSILRPETKINPLVLTHAEHSHPCAFMIRSSPLPAPSPASNKEQDLFDRWHKVNEKLGKIVNLKPSYIKDDKEQSIKSYQTRYNARHGTIIEPATPNLEAEHVISPLVSNTPQPTSNSLWKNDDNLHIHKCFADVIGRIDEMNMNTELLKVKHQNLVGKYGGDDFWNQFIRSLYKKIVSKESNLHTFFNGRNLDMIIVGMFKVFNGCATLEFRRRIKAAHQNMGISEKEFNVYSDFFESTLNEFKIEEGDKRVIMTQIRSMRCLICQFHAGNS
ncbi:unnamed protein product [Blepharisma stoltei]|uniref:Uncharacterized protein n=1 Tax=Blepharisma stoltei TaxID=1481888 RepID=A0AAU9KML5_9CILI|nr:unnamed protein product [Blepharisma stoltei]